jgi:hypothetical protein
VEVLDLWLSGDEESADLYTLSSNHINVHTLNWGYYLYQLPAYVRNCPLMAVQTTEWVVTARFT